MELARSASIEIRPMHPQSIREAMKVSAWVDQLLEMDDCEHSDSKLASIARRWCNRTPEPPEMILEWVENQLLQEFGIE
jgi:siderophore synthetase component